MVMEPKGEKVGELEDVSKNGLRTSAVLEPAAADGGKGKPVCGRYHESPWQQNKEEWSQSLKKRQVRRADQAPLPTLAHSFVACGRARVPHAPA